MLENIGTFITKQGGRTFGNSEEEFLLLFH
jgi:hypothetical protein